MSHRPALSAIEDVTDFETYPIGNDDRLTSHYFLTWHFDRWLNSELRLTASAAVRGLAFDLFNIAQRQTPVGTLPDDDRQLAALLLLSREEWERFKGEQPSPLHNWRRCLCEGGVVRLMHPVVLEMVEDAQDRRQAHVANSERAKTMKRLARLREAIGQVSSRLAQNDDLVDWVDDWLLANVDHHGNRRTLGRVRQACEIYSTKGE